MNSLPGGEPIFPSPPHVCGKNGGNEPDDRDFECTWIIDGRFVHHLNGDGDDPEARVEEVIVSSDRIDDVTEPLLSLGSFMPFEALKEMPGRFTITVKFEPKIGQ